MSTHTGAGAYRSFATEADTQKLLTDWLAWSGYEVLVTSRQWTRCAECGSRERKQDGATRGLPDILVWKAGWTGWLGVEVKTKTGRLRPEQKRLADMGSIVVVRGLEDLQLALAVFEVELKGHQEAR